MIKSSKHIEIVRSTAKGLSSMSQASANAIFDVLDKHFAEVSIRIINNASDLDRLIAIHPDLVFLGMEYVPADHEQGLGDPPKMWLSDIFDKQNIAYTGSNQTAHVLARFKPLAKQRILENDLKTTAYCVIRKDQPMGRDAIGIDYPLFIKPANRGGGLGIDSNSVAYRYEQLESKVHAINTTLDSDALIEEYLPGREFSVAILKDEFKEEYLALPIELVAPLDECGRRLLGSKIKSANTEQALVVTDPSLKSKIITLALKAFKALGARDYGRIDIRLDAKGTPYFLEANLIPSLICGYGSFPKACVLNIGLEYESMIMRIANLGLARNSMNPKTLSEKVMIEPAFYQLTAEGNFNPIGTNYAPQILND